MFRIGDYVKHIDNGRKARVMDVQPIGLSVLIVVEDCETGEQTRYFSIRLREWIGS